ncbi:MAG: hypothetical protein ACHQIM_19890 [Sphingobacteriales bacterium]
MKSFINSFFGNKEKRRKSTLNQDRQKNEQGISTYERYQKMDCGKLGAILSDFEKHGIQCDSGTVNNFAHTPPSADQLALYQRQEGIAAFDIFQSKCTPPRALRDITVTAEPVEKLSYR